ncbi:hypothetical protein N657DRAFT_149012 [Parathielavia appendiculata]|uniref:Uncharacterized protein n=1 Tax=Parathielavia appendiculata TaxID=2587402 RepID=A0AAN6TUS4_9PEZI|nr:hypothetical protein N657DRAFT_149012 [Parathielavia appendiculata]
MGQKTGQPNRDWRPLICRQTILLWKIPASKGRIRLEVHIAVNMTVKNGMGTQRHTGNTESLCAGGRPPNVNAWDRTRPLRSVTCRSLGSEFLARPESDAAHQTIFPGQLFVTCGRESLEFWIVFIYEVHCVGLLEPRTPKKSSRNPVCGSSRRGDARLGRNTVLNG